MRGECSLEISHLYVINWRHVAPWNVSSGLDTEHTIVSKSWLCGQCLDHLVCGVFRSLLNTVNANRWAGSLETAKLGPSSQLCHYHLCSFCKSFDFCQPPCPQLQNRSTHMLPLHCVRIKWEHGYIVSKDYLAHGSRTRLSDFTFTFHFYALEKEMATHSSVLAWRIPGTGEPGGLPSMGSHRVGHDWSDLAAAAAAEGGQ